MTVSITVDKLVSVLVFAAMLALTALFYPIGSAVAAMAVASFLCVPGLVLIWFADALAETPCFARGVECPSPPSLVTAMGWLFLVGYPAFLFYAAS